MKNSKRILSVTIKRMLDDSPDTSWLGEYSNHATSEFSIDRAHSTDCRTNTLEMPPNETTHNIDVVYARETQGTCADCGATVDECFIKPCEHYSPADDCDCGERGDMERGQYRYFNPSFNYVDKNGKATDTPENVRKYTRQDYERMERLNRGDWCFIGIRAEANYVLKSWGRWETDKQMFTGGCGPIQTLTSGGLWGIESDSDTAYMESVEQGELSDLKTQLLALGFSKRSISVVFKTVERKEN